MIEVAESLAEQVQAERAFSMEEAIREGGIDNKKITDYWRPRWEWNFCAGFHMIRPDTMNLRSLAMNWDGQTAIVVSTGPSLDRNIKEMLAADRSTFKIIASTSALNPLIANGLKPDLAVINDGAPWVASLHFAGIEDYLKDVPLVIGTTCHPETAKSWPGPRYYYHDYCPDDELLGPDGLCFRVLPQFTGIPVSGCTSNCAARIAVYLGFQRIIFVGADLSYPNRQSHCTKYEHIAPKDLADGEVHEAAIINPDGSIWRPLPAPDEYFKAKAAWLMHVCPKGCSYVVNAWKPTDPIEWSDKHDKCSVCKEPMRHLPTSAEYQFYAQNMLPLSGATMELDIEGVQMIRKPSVINATMDGIACAMPCMPFTEALEWTRPDAMEEEPAAPVEVQGNKGG